MPDFSANLSTMFNELPFLERFAAAARHGFAAVEFLSMHGCAAGDVACRLRESGLTLVSCHLPGADREPGLPCDPDRIHAFRDAARRGVDLGASLNCRFVVVRAGAMAAGWTAERQMETLIANLQFAASEAMAEGIGVLLEAVDTFTLPGAFPNATRQALDIVDTAGARNLSLLYDVWHMHVMGEPVREMIERYLPRIGHIEIAGYPGRGAPVNGSIDFDDLLDHLDRIGHHGWVGCEYYPEGDTDSSLAWMARHRRLTPACRPVWGIPQAALEGTWLQTHVKRSGSAAPALGW